MPRKRHKKWSGERDRFRAVFQYELHLRHLAKEVSDDEFDKAMLASERDRVIDEVMEEYHKAPEFDTDWGSLVTWIQENWTTILKAVMALVMLFLDEGEDD